MTKTARPIEWPTLLMLLLTYGVWGVGTVIWADTAIVALVLTTLAITQHSSLQHEALHGHPFRNAALNEALVFPALSVFVPYRRFRDTHLQHHFDPALTDPYDDPEANYLDPDHWARMSPWRQRVLRWNNTLAGRMLLGPAIGLVQFVGNDIRAILRGDRLVARGWAAHAVGAVPVVAWLVWVGTMPFWAYVLAAYLGMALLKIRTFLEHRAHDQFRARTVVVEDRGPLALLFLNNNFHVVHHMHPAVPWYQLPGLYTARKAHFLRRNDGYAYRNYGQIFRTYLWCTKDPVPHPIWPMSKCPPKDDP